MFNILLYGSEKDTVIEKMLLKVLSKSYHINVIKDEMIYSIGNINSKAINIIEISSVSSISLANSLLIIKENAKVQKLKRLNQDMKVICDISNMKAIDYLSSKINYLYTCGFSSKSHITFSSKEGSNALVSLQRQVNTLNERCCDPLEIPCIVNETESDYPILAVVLSLIFIEEIDENFYNNNVDLMF